MSIDFVAFRFHDSACRSERRAMSLDRSWQFIGSADSWTSRLYDWLRRGVNARLVNFLVARASPPRTLQTTTRALEAGSGTGFATSLLSRTGAFSQCICLDLDIDALRAAKARDPQLPVVVGDLRRMPFADGVFDLAFNSSTVEHLDEPGDAVAEMQRVCRPTGRVFVGVPYQFGPLAFQPMIQRTRIGVWLGTVFTRQALDRLLRGAGLRPRRFISYFWWFFVGAVAEKACPPQTSG